MNLNNKIYKVKIEKFIIDLIMKSNHPDYKNTYLPFVVATGALL